jgi:hypothetical protein
MIYLDSSVALAYLLAEDCYPSNALWRPTVVSSRLLECEVWNRINARRLRDSHGDAARVPDRPNGIIEMLPPVLKPALDPFPVPVRTLDAIGAIEFIPAQGASIQLASYDERMVGAARFLGITEWHGNE